MIQTPLNPYLSMSSYETPARIQELTIGRFIEECAHGAGDRVALQFIPDGRFFTYLDLHVESNRYANGLSAIGVGHGTHVAIMLENSPEFLLLLLALGKIGAVAVPLSPTLKGDLLTYFIQHSDARILVLNPKVSEMPVGCLLDWVLTHDGEVESGHPVTAATSVCTLTSLATDRSRDLGREPRFSDLAMLMYTSGTTGPSKANMFSHAHVLQYAYEQMAAYGYGPDDVVYTCLPISHANGLLSSTYGAFAARARVALAKKFSVSRFWSEVRQSGSTFVGLLGSMSDFLWNAPRAEGEHDDHPLRRVVMIPVPHYGPAFSQRFNVSLLSSYGLTDYGLATVFRPEDPANKMGSAGRPRRGMHVRIVDENEMPCPPGHLGEILLRSDNPWATSSGYYKMPEETLAAIRDLWFHTGDRGYLDADGYLFFVDRKKDAIRRRGENVSAFEVERAIQSHPAVREAAVFAVQADEAEDEIAACVALVPGAVLSEDGLAAHCEQHLAKFMVPRFIRFIPELPKTGSQKIEKYKLRAQAQSEMDLYWDRLRKGAEPLPQSHISIAA